MNSELRLIRAPWAHKPRQCNYRTVVRDESWTEEPGSVTRSRDLSSRPNEDDVKRSAHTGTIDTGCLVLKTHTVENTKGSCQV